MTNVRPSITHGDNGGWVFYVYSILDLWQWGFYRYFWGWSFSFGPFELVREYRPEDWSQV